MLVKARQLIKHLSRCQKRAWNACSCDLSFHMADQQINRTWHCKWQWQVWRHRQYSCFQQSFCWSCCWLWLTSIVWFCCMTLAPCQVIPVLWLHVLHCCLLKQLLARTQAMLLISAHHTPLQPASLLARSQPSTTLDCWVVSLPEAPQHSLVSRLGHEDGPNRTCILLPNLPPHVQVSLLWVRDVSNSPQCFSISTAIVVNCEWLQGWKQVTSKPMSTSQTQSRGYWSTEGKSFSVSHWVCTSITSLLLLIWIHALHSHQLSDWPALIFRYFWLASCHEADANRSNVKQALHFYHTFFRLCCWELALNNTPTTSAGTSVSLDEPCKVIFPRYGATLQHQSNLWYHELTSYSQTQSSCVTATHHNLPDGQNVHTDASLEWNPDVRKLAVQDKHTIHCRTYLENNRLVFKNAWSLPVYHTIMPTHCPEIFV